MSLVKLISTLHLQPINVSIFYVSQWSSQFRLYGIFTPFSHIKSKTLENSKGQRGINLIRDSCVGHDKHSFASCGFGKLGYLLQTVVHFQRGQMLFPVSFLNYLSGTTPLTSPRTDYSEGRKAAAHLVIIYQQNKVAKIHTELSTAQPWENISEALAIFFSQLHSFSNALFSGLSRLQHLNTPNKCANSF